MKANNLYLPILLAFISAFCQAQNYWHVDRVQTNVGFPDWTDIALQSPTEVWLSTEDSTIGLVKWNNGQVTEYSTSNSQLLSNVILDIEFFHDTLWVATEAGVQYFNGSFALIGMVGIGEQWVVSPNDDLYIKSDSLVFKYNNGQFNLHYAQQAGHISTFTVDASDNLWLGSYYISNLSSENLLRKFDGTTTTHFTSQDITGNEQFIVLSNITPVNNHVAFASNHHYGDGGGVFKYDGQTWEKTNVHDGLRSNAQRLIIADQQNQLWTANLEYNRSDRLMSKVNRISNDVTTHDPVESVALLNDVKTLNDKIYYASNDGYLVHAQTNVPAFPKSDFIDANNIYMELASNGSHNFLQEFDGRPTFEINKGDSTYAIAEWNLWVGAKTDDNQIRCSAAEFTAVDFFEGGYNEAGAFYRSAIVKVTRAQVEQHIAKYSSSLYIVPENIQSWPGNGSASVGDPVEIAPYEDVNDNGIYDPQNGDYPSIRGDQAVFFIYNDARFEGALTGGDATNIEVQCMVYAYDSIESDALNNAIFMNVALVNRGNEDYSEVKLGMRVDFDLGNAQDDYVGSDSVRNTFYVYNGDNVDQNAGGNNGFGESPPAVGVRTLSHSLDHFQYHNNSPGPTGDNFSTDENIWNYLNARWLDGTHLTYGGNGYNTSATNYTNFMFSGNPVNGTGWTESSAGNPSADRRGIGSFPAVSLEAGERACFDLVIGVGRSTSGYLASVSKMLSNLDEIAEFYDNQHCIEGDLSTAHEPPLSVESMTETSGSSLFPNPSNGRFYIQTKEAIESIEIMDINGRIVSSVRPQQGVRMHELNIPEGSVGGLYLVKCQLANGEYNTSKLLFQSRN